MAEEQTELNALDQILTEGKMARAPGQRAYARDLVDEFIESVASDATSVSTDTLALVSQKINELDGLINDQLNEIMHHDGFKQLGRAVGVASTIS